LHSDEDKTFIATHGLNVPENEAFIYFADHFRRKRLHVPEILAVSYDKTIYLQEDFGKVSLLNVLESKGFTQEVYDLFKESLKQLAHLQVIGDEGLNYKKCLTNEEFGKQAIMADLLYFKYYFLDALQRPYDKQKLIDDFEALSNYLTHTEYKYFMFRDFQSRNILVTDDNEVHFIDFQGGMKGAPQYDVASMIWQARANLPDEWKTNLLEDYMDAFEEVIDNTIDREVFRSQFNGYVLIRLLQVLGAYGFRGLFERKAQFLTSIPSALKNLKWFFENQSLGIVLPEFKRVLTICTDDEIVERFSPLQASEETPLVVKICSFSYRKGIPDDANGNGGGFVFDCRGIENPGRYDEYKENHGRDKSVVEFLERQTKMQTFLNSVFDLVDISVEEYIKRGFTSLAVNFGCTGGQHRSVYAADALARHLRNKYKVKIELSHREQDEKNWINKLEKKEEA
jgi:aminoglycoside/choline kinase family phosphotransferase